MVAQTRVMWRQISCVYLVKAPSRTLNSLSVVVGQYQVFLLGPIAA